VALLLLVVLQPIIACQLLVAKGGPVAKSNSVVAGGSAAKGGSSANSSPLAAGGSAANGGPAANDDDCFYYHS